MKYHAANDNKLRISEVLIKSCSLMIKNIKSLLILSVVLFLVLYYMYEPIGEKFSALIQHEYVGTYIVDFKKLDFIQDFIQDVIQATDDYNSSYTELGGEPLFTPLSPVAVIFFSFLLPVAIIRLLFATDPPKGSFIERALYKLRLIKSPGYIISSFRYICAVIAQMVLFIYLPVLLGIFMFIWSVNLGAIWMLGLFLLFVSGYIYFLFRFTAVFQLAYVSISIENMGVWESWKRGYSMSSPSWIRVSTLFAIILPLILLIFASILLLLLPAEEPDGLGTLVLPHVIQFIFVVFSAIFSAVCYQELKKTG